MARVIVFTLGLFGIGACASPVGLAPEGAGGNVALGGASSGGAHASGGGATGGSATGGSGTGGSGGGAGSTTGGTGGSGALGGTGSGGSARGGTGGSGGAPCVPPVPGGLCDPVTQCGCGAGFNCDVQGSTGFTSCGPSGSKLANQPCTTPTECATGTSCVGYSCKPFCNTLADCPLTGASCLQVYMGVPVPGWHSCSSGCALENPSARCGAGTTCAVVLPDITDCVGGVGAGIGPGTCLPGNDLACAPGYACAGGTCAKWCRIGQNDCPTGSCTGGALSTTVGGVAYGTCS
jgi:hypothetical protein